MIEQPFTLELSNASQIDADPSSPVTFNSSLRLIGSHHQFDSHSFHLPFSDWE